MRPWRLIVAVLLLWSLALEVRAERRIDFNREIRPLLSDKCFACHGPDEKQRQAGLRLDTQDGIVAKLESGQHALVPGKVAESAILARVTNSNADEIMPPPATGKTLTPGQIELLKRWIEQGGELGGHWSFIAPTRPPLPTIANPSWAANPIDLFVAARLEKEGLPPTPIADKTTLLRRVTFDLTGLPPTIAEMDGFLADQSSNAFEKVVDRLLKSPRFGEHLARYWLDVARYGDTHGLHLDNERAMWKYRDYVIGAFNDNKPFDQFVVEQVAGDLLPSATVDQRIATGFCRCNVTTSEGGSINDEVLVRYAVDRTESIGTVFMGLTLGCAVCHDHKFDPISQKEFYQLYAFFNAAADAAMDGNQLAPPPILKVPTGEQTTQLASLDEKLVTGRKRVADELAKIEYTEPVAATAVGTEPKEFVWIDDATPPNAKQQGNTPWEFVGKPEHPVFSGEKASRRQAQGLSQHFFEGASPGLKVGEGDKFFAYVFLDPKSPPKEIMLQWNDGSWEHRAYWGDDVIPWGGAGSAARLPMGKLPNAGEWVRLEVEAAKVGLAAGATLNGWAFTQQDGTCYWDKAGIVTRTPQEGQSFESLLAWEAYEKAQTKSAVPQAVRDAIKVETDKRNDAQKKSIRDYFLEHIYAQTKLAFDPLHQEVATLEKQRKETDDAIPVTLVMADLPKPRDTHVLIRGAYNKPGDKVEAAVPSVFPILPTGESANRLGLARWLTSPMHPLTARVTANRFWQNLFGRGLVKTAEDFGSQGEQPTHPELLDWLAIEFQESGWNTKQLLKLIVMSSTYRQASRVSAELVQRDPENAMLARGPRFRLDAETVRDEALFISGLFVEKIGGKSVKPYQPAGIWEAVGFIGRPPRVPGMNSAVYHDHVSGAYVLAFAGTDDVQDVLVNLWQGLGGYTAQYEKAMEIAVGLETVFKLNERALVTTGHSLGGGLASAASVAAAIKADTFNAAGLLETTLRKRDGNGDIIPNSELYPGSLARYGNAPAWIDAYFLDWDLLSFVQDNTPLQDAIGWRCEMEGPLDWEIGVSAAFLAAQLISGAGWGTIFLSLGQAGYYMGIAHTTLYYQYGLMVNESTGWDIYGYDL